MLLGSIENFEIFEKISKFSKMIIKIGLDTSEDIVQFRSRMHFSMAWNVPQLMARLICEKKFQTFFILIFAKIFDFFDQIFSIPKISIEPSDILRRKIFDLFGISVNYVPVAL